VEEYGVQGLVDLFLQTNDLGCLIEKAAEVLKNPLLVCDTSYHFLGWSNVSGIGDKSWLAGVKRGGWSYELVSLINSLDLDYSGQEHKTQILDSINQESSSRRMIGTLCMDGAHLGYYFILEENTPFDEVEEQTYRKAASVLAKSVSSARTQRLPGGGRSSEGIMLDLLQNGFDSRSLFLERAGENYIARTGNYRVFCIPVRKKGRDVSGNRGFHSLIGHCLPLSWQVRFQDNIVVLADFGSRLYRRPDELEAFRSFLVQHGLCAGFSDMFSDPYELKRHYEQAHAATHLGTAFEDERSLIPYEDYKVYSLFLNVSDKDLFNQYSTEAVRRIHEYDLKNATDYLETLCHYLGSQCSVQKTADRLYVHRNTVAYRMGKIRELFGISFEDDRQNYLNYTSCLLRRYCDRVDTQEKRYEKDRSRG